MKKLIIGICIGVVVSVAGSAWAIGIMGKDANLTPAVVSTGEPVIVGVQEAIQVVKPSTGTETPVIIITPQEARFRSIEARLNLLESKQK